MVDNPTEKPLIQPMVPTSNGTDRSKLIALAVIFVAIIAGAATGYGIYQVRTSGTVRIGGERVKVVNSPTEEGVVDAAKFPDTATGTLEVNDGKITKEGSYVLVRGDVSQNAYLTSSVVDLDKFVGKKVQVWGQTFQGQKAGWLMDIGRIKIVN